MAVYTQVAENELEIVLKQFDIGAIQELRAIEEGVENSNYFLTTDRNRYVLTIFEKRVNEEDLPFYLQLMQHLANKSFPCPIPIASKNDELLIRIKDRPATIISFLQGKSVKVIRNHHCHALGKALARLHEAAKDFPLAKKNQLSLPHWHELYAPLASQADTVKMGLANEIQATLDQLQQEWPTDLPHGIIHADAFPDNVFFMEEDVSGIIDFYFACNDFYMYDVAICLNAWCFEPNGDFNITKARALVAGYNAIRTISNEELAALPILASGAAMRFLLTRLHDWVNQVEGALVKPKNPLEYLHKIRFHKGVKGASAYVL